MSSIARNRLRCPDCRRRTRGVLPRELVGSAFGPRLQAAVVTLSARNRVSRRDISELARELFAIGISVGAIDGICQRAASALAGPHELLATAVLASPAVNLDETGWRTAGEKPHAVDRNDACQLQTRPCTGAARRG